MGNNFVTTEQTLSQNETQVNWTDLANKVHLDANRENEIHRKAQDKKDVMKQALSFMVHHKTFKFDDLEKALKIIRDATSASAFGQAEVALQRQIDTIRKMSDVDMTIEDQSRCIYALQNLIFSLSDRKLPNKQKNDFVPKIIQDYGQMLLKGSMMGLDWERFEKSVYINKYQVPKDEQWRYLDPDLIKSNMEYLVSYRAKTTTQSINDQQIISTKTNQRSVVYDYCVREELMTDAEINQILSKAITKFDPLYLKNHFSEFFNFVKDEMLTTSKTPDEVEYPVLHKVVLKTMRYIVQIGNNQQMKAAITQMAETQKRQNETGGKSL